MKTKILFPFILILTGFISFIPFNQHRTGYAYTIAQTDTSIRGLSYSGFLGLTKLDTPQTNQFGPSLWTLWEGEQWQPLENLVATNHLNGTYPPAAGFVNLDTITLATGTKLDRYGSLWGSFVAPEGASFTVRSLPDTCQYSIYYQFVVTKPIPAVLAGKAIPWFGQTGMGMQYMFNTHIKNLIKEQYLKITKTVPARPIPTKVMVKSRSAGKVTQPVTDNEHFIVDANGTNIPVSLSEFINNPLQNMQANMRASSFNLLVTNAGLSKPSSANAQYVSKRGLPVYYFAYKAMGSNKRYWVAVSYGEVSATNFRLTFEGIIEVKP